MWSLESELAELLREDDYVSGLQRAGVLRKGERVQKLVPDGEWVPGGGETYIFPFSVYGESGTFRKLILKAFTPAPGTVSVRDGLQNMLARREELRRFGVAVPQLLGSSGGTWCEDFIPHDLWTRISSPNFDSSHVDKLLSSLFRVAFAMDVLLFAPIDPFRDLRTDDIHAYMIDFGSDLGPPRVAKSNMYITEELEAKLLRLGAFPPDKVMKAKFRGRASIPPEEPK